MEDTTRAFSFNLSSWLTGEGYLIPAASEGHRKLVDSGLDMLRKVDRQGVLMKTVGHRLAKRVRGSVGKARIFFDPTASRAYADVTQIYGLIHLLEPSEPARAHLEQEISAKLLAFTDPQTGRSVIRRVWRKDELYNGPACDKAPDLVVEPHSDFSVSSSVRMDQPVLVATVPEQDLHLGTHAPEGILLVHGGDVQGGTIPDSDIVDLAPTILWLLGLEVPEGLDGSVLRHLFTGERPLPGAGSGQISNADDAFAGAATGLPTGTPSDGSVSEGYTAEEEAEIEGMLKNLGYLE